jgi:hypothetical protein
MKGEDSVTNGGMREQSQAEKPLTGLQERTDVGPGKPRGGVSCLSDNCQVSPSPCGLHLIWVVIKTDRILVYLTYLKKRKK